MTEDNTKDVWDAPLNALKDVLRDCPGSYISKQKLFSAIRKGLENHADLSSIAKDNAEHIFFVDKEQNPAIRVQNITLLGTPKYSIVFAYDGKEYNLGTYGWKNGVLVKLITS
jgi:hypothetical protein